MRPTISYLDNRSMPNLIFRSVLGPVLLLFSSICLSVQAQEELRSIAEALGTIEELDLRAHVEVLADDSLEGREAGSRGGARCSKIYCTSYAEIWP